MHLVKAYRSIVAKDLTVDDFQDFFEELAKNGMDDKKQWAGMLNRAKEIAKSQGKEGDKDTIVGIMQSFMHK